MVQELTHAFPMMPLANTVQSSATNANQANSHPKRWLLLVNL